MHMHVQLLGWWQHLGHLLQAPGPATTPETQVADQLWVSHHGHHS
jgi:hypothetical protein